MFGPTRRAAWRRRNGAATTAACGASEHCKHANTHTPPHNLVSCPIGVSIKKRSEEQCCLGICGPAALSRQLCKTVPPTPQNAIHLGMIAAYWDHLGAPGHSRIAPGHSRIAPGHSATAPGQARNARVQTGNALGHSINAPGQTGNAAGHSTNAPGQIGEFSKSPGANGKWPGAFSKCPGAHVKCPGDKWEMLRGIPPMPLRALGPSPPTFSGLFVTLTVATHHSASALSVCRRFVRPLTRVASAKHT